MLVTFFKPIWHNKTLISISMLVEEFAPEGVVVEEIWRVLIEGFKCYF